MVANHDASCSVAECGGSVNVYCHSEHHQPRVYAMSMHVGTCVVLLLQCVLFAGILSARGGSATGSIL